jgi:hypothetical protein
MEWLNKFTWFFINFIIGIYTVATAQAQGLCRLYVLVTMWFVEQ